MSQHGWLDGSYDDAMRLVAERLVLSRSVGGLTKAAVLDWPVIPGLPNTPTDGGQPPPAAGTPPPGSERPTPASVEKAIEALTERQEKVPEAPPNLGSVSAHKRDMSPPDVSAHKRDLLTSKAYKRPPATPAAAAPAASDGEPAGGGGIAGFLQSAWANPHIQRALIGAGVGAAGGGLMSLFDKDRRKRLFGNILTGGLLGGAIGGGGSLAYEHLFNGKLPGSEDPSIAGNPAKVDAVRKIDRGMQEVGLLGANPVAANAIIEKFRANEITRAEALAELQKLTPGAGEQASNALYSAPGTAIQQGRFDQVPAQLDVLGLKALGLGTTYFDPHTAGASLAANLTARAGGKYLRGMLPSGIRSMMASNAVSGLDASNAAVQSNVLARLDPAILQKINNNQPLTATESSAVERQIRQYRRSTGGVSRFLTGGWGPLLAGLAPLVAHEWLGRGYRSGTPAYREMLSAADRLKG